MLNALSFAKQKMTREINYFDTPHSRRNGGAPLANFIGKVLDDRAAKRDAITETLKEAKDHFIPLAELTKHFNENPH